MSRTAVGDAVSVSAEWLAHPLGICVLAWSWDGTRLASAGNDGLIHIWDPGDTAAGPVRTLVGHKGSVRSLSWSPGDDHVVSGAEDGLGIVWDARTGTCRAVLRWHTRFVNAVAWSPDGATIVTASGDRRLVVWDAAGGAVRDVLPSPYGTFLSVAWSPDGRLLASCSRTREVTIWDARSWSGWTSIAAGSGTVWSLDWFAGSRYVAVGGNDGAVVILDTSAADAVACMEGHGDTVARVTCSASGHIVASLSHDQTIGLWSLDEPRCLARIGDAYPGWTGCLTFHPADPVLAGTDSSGRSVRLWAVPGAGAGPAARKRRAAHRLRSGQHGRYRDATCEAAIAVLEQARSHGGVSIETEAVDRCLPPHLRGSAGRGMVARGVARRLDNAGDLLLVDRERRIVLPARSLRALVRRLDSCLRDRGDGVHQVRLAEMLAEDGNPHGHGALDQRDLVWRACGSYLLRQRRAWLDATAGPDVVRVPVLTGREESIPVLVDLVDTTLFRAWAWHGGDLWLRQEDGTAAAIKAQADVLTVRITAAADQRSAQVLASMLERRLARRGPEGLTPRVEPADDPGAVPPSWAWQPWGAEASRTWALSWGDLPPSATEAAEITDEFVDDERARQERLLWASAAGRAEDAVVCHLPEDQAAASRIAAELAVLGIQASSYPGPAAGPVEPVRAAVTKAHRAGAVIFLVSARMDGDFDRLPITGFYDGVVARTRQTGDRIRWLPTVLQDAAGSGVPDYLRSFDWFSWSDEPRSKRRAAMVGLLGGVIVDRARS